MSYQTLQTISQIAIAFGLIIAAVGGYGAYHYGQMKENKKDMEEAAREEKKHKTTKTYGEIHSPIATDIAKMRVGQSQTIFFAPRGFMALQPFDFVPIKLFINSKNELTINTTVRDWNGKIISVIDENKWTFFEKDGFEYNYDSSAYEIVTMGDRKVILQIEFNNGIASVSGLFVNEKGGGIYIYGGLEDKLRGPTDPNSYMISNIRGRVELTSLPPGEFAVGYDSEDRYKLQKPQLLPSYERIIIPELDLLFKYPREENLGERNNPNLKYPF